MSLLRLNTELLVGMFAHNGQLLQGSCVCRDLLARLRRGDDADSHSPVPMARTLHLRLLSAPSNEVEARQLLRFLRRITRYNLGMPACWA